MQHRMKENPLTKTQIDELLQLQAVGHFATNGADGFPYVTPVHFALLDGKLYFHGLPKGEKLDNIKANDKVCLETCVMKGLILPEENEPCSVNTGYESVIVKGRANILTDFESKKKALSAIINKYTPELDPKRMPEAAIKGTAVVEITPEEVTGKYYE